MADRVKLPLCDVVEKLIDYRGKSPKKSATGIPVISAKVVKSGRILENIEQTIAPGYYDEWMRRGLPEIGDVVMTTEGPMGEVAQLDARTSRYALGQRIVTLRGKPGILHNGYLKFLLMSPEVQARLEARATGTTVLGISQKQLRDLPLPILGYSEQEAIAALLGALDDKIELNRRMSATLEEMARALYRSWFVDFDPVHARALGQRPAHMDATTAALFPDSFGPDGLPKGWKAGNLGDLIDFNPKEKLPKGTPAPYLEMKALPTSGMTPDGPYTRDFTSGTKFRERDTLLARITPCLENGKTALVDDLLGAEIGWGSTEFIVMRAKKGISYALPYCIARDADFRAEAIQTMIGSSGRQRADAKRIAELNAAMAPQPVHDAFSEFVSPIFDRIIGAGQEARILTTLRDTLLPRLMSGELRIRDAEKQVEDAL